MRDPLWGLAGAHRRNRDALKPEQPCGHTDCTDAMRLTPFLLGQTVALAIACLIVTDGTFAQAPPAQASAGKSAVDICNATMNDARAERQRNQPGAARNLAEIVMKRCLDLVPGLRAEAQGIVAWADRPQQQAEPARSSPEDGSSLPEPDVPTLSRGSGQATSMMRALTSPPAAAATTTGASGSATNTGLDTASCKAQAEEAGVRGGAFLRQAPGMMSQYHGSATMLRAAIDALRPCAADPLVAAEIKQYERSLQSALDGCRALASDTSACDRPAY